MWLPDLAEITCGAQGIRFDQLIMATKSVAPEALRGSVTLFVGAGTAFWLDTALAFGGREEVQKLLNDKRYEEAAQICLAARGPQWFNDRLQSGYGDHKLAGCLFVADQIPRGNDGNRNAAQVRAGEGRPRRPFLADSTFPVRC